MRKMITLLVLLSFAMGTMTAQNTRYIDEVFTDVIKLSNQLYSVNVTVVTGAPAADTLLFDLYMPAGDTCTARPLAVILHTGTFLPRGLFAPTGDKDDYANVQICERLAKRGYVAASIQYRAGWNPVALQDTVRRSTIINAAYRGIQDLFAFIRYANLTVEDLDNPYKIDPNRIAVFGIGTGGFVGFNAAVLQQEEIYIDKFTNPSGASMIDTNLIGNLTGEKPGLINVPNHVGYSNKFHFVFGLDGAVGDSSWMEDGTSVPMAAAGTVTHPTTPFGIDPVSGDINCELPVYAGAGTGSFVVNIGGSVCMIEKANSLGINNPLNKVEYNDPVSVALRNAENNFGQEHLWAINLPGAQTGPWEYWDSTFWKTIPFPLNPALSLHDVAIVTNPDMGFDKANRYIDTSVWFFSPRAYTALKLGDLVCSCVGAVPDLSIITDFECQRNFTFGNGSDRLMVMDNPLSTGFNSSAKVGSYNDAANDPWAALCVSNGEPLDLATYNSFQFDMVSPAAGTPILIKLEGGTSPVYETFVNTSVAGDWETITGDFSSQVSADHLRICIFPNAGNDQPEGTYLLDNLRLEFVEGLFSPSIPDLEISPNPVSHVLYVRNPGSADVLVLTDMMGRELMRTDVRDQQIGSMILGHVQTGMYIVSARNDEGKIVAVSKIMKN